MFQLATRPGSRFRLSVILVTSLTLVVPPEAFMSRAYATPDPPNENTNGLGCPVDCPPYPAEESRKTQGGPSGEVGTDPVFFYRGAAVEAETDLYLPGPVFDWSHTRSYDSGLTNSSGGAYPAYSGERWFSDVTGPYLQPDGSSIDLITTASTKLTMGGPPDMNGNYSPPPGWRITFTVDSMQDTLDYDGDTNDTESFDVFTLTFVDSGTIYKFLGFSANIPPARQGRLVEKTTRSYVAANKIGIRYLYDTNGLVSTITTAQPQEWQIAYTYTGTPPKVTRISVKDGSNAEIQYAEYTYHGFGTSDRGSAGDLTQVKIGRKTTDGGFTTRTTQYRYYHSGSTNGKQHQLKSVFEPDAIARITQAGNVNFDTPAEILAANDTDTVAGGFQIRDYASRSFTYYQANESTNSITTPFGTHNLESDYGGGNLNEFLASGPLVKKETIHGVCGSCGASGQTVTRSYFYMWVNQSTDDLNEVEKIVVEDTDVDGTASNGNEVQRRIYGLNPKGVALRKVLIENPTDMGFDAAWCQSIILGDGFIVERRMPSAHAATVVNNGDVAQFLDPYDESTSSWTNDDATLDNDGVIYLYDYEDGGDRIYDVMVKKGKGGTANLLLSTDYGDGSTNAIWDVVSVCEYPTPTATRGNGNTTTFAYTYWSGTGLNRRETVTAKLPIVPTTENGAGGTDGTDNIKFSQYFDQLGRLRWTKDGEGYVDYVSYHPDTGGLAYVGIDVDPSSMPTDATTETTKRVSANDDGTGTYTTGKPTRSGTLGETELVTKIEFDAQGREVIRTEPGNRIHVTRYEVNKTIEFPYIDTDMSSGTYGKPLMPVGVTTTDTGGTLTAAYSIDPAQATASGGMPTGVNDSSTYYTSLTEFDYETVSGRLASVERYHDIGGSGSYTTSFLYDDQGRRGATIEEVAASKFQVTVHLFDVLDRVIETRRGVVSSAPTVYTALASSSPAMGYARVSQIDYDENEVGDSHVTSSRSYYSDTGDFIERLYKRTFRGHLRGIDQKNNASQFGPYAVADIDWMGRTTASAVYESAPMTWPTDYSDYVYDSINEEPETADHYNLTVAFYDVLNRVYRVHRYPGEEDENHFEINNYFDRNNRLVAKGNKYAAHMEYAYDGAGRQFQSRAVLALQTSVNGPYDGDGVFQYCEPLPDPHWKAGTMGLDVTNVAMGNMSGGDEGVIEFSHTVYNAASNAVQQHLFEMNHHDTNGLDLGGNDDYVRRSVYSWFDGADLPEVTADHGSGDTATDQGAWKYVAVPAYDPADPLDWSDTAVFEGDVLLTKYDYDAAGRRDTVAIGVSEGSSNTNTMTSTSFYDDLGRPLFVVENHKNNYDPTSGIGPVTPGENRTTARIFNGLNRVTDLTAYNSGSSTNQLTKYLYEHAYHAQLVTNAIYPDSSDTTSSGTNQVKLSYYLDGLINTRTDQRGVVLTYDHDKARRLKAQGVTSFGSSGIVDETIKSITRKYDDLGRLEKVTSHGNLTDDPDNTTNVQNQIKYTYNTVGLVSASDQDHTDAVGSGTAHQTVGYAYSEEDDGGIYAYRLRPFALYYPSGRTFYMMYDGTVNDRLDRPSSILDQVSATLTQYAYNGTGRLATSEYPIPDLKLDYNLNDDATYEGYDRFGRVIDHHWDGYGSTPDGDQFKYGYDYASNRLWRENVVAAAQTTPVHLDEFYDNDGLHRLKNAQRGNLTGTFPNYTGVTSKNFAQDFTLDQLGNWTEFDEDEDGTGWSLEQSRDHNAANEITSVGLQSMGAGSNWVDPGCDAAGNMVLMPAVDQPTAEVAATYDAWNRLVGLDGLVMFEYDGLHRRIRTEVVETSERHFYYNEAWQVLEERTTVTGNPVAQYVWHPYYIDALAVRYYDADVDGNLAENNDGRHWYLQDANFNVTAVVNDSGAPLERYRYTPYGEVTFLEDDFDVKTTQASAIGNEILYTGRARDSITGLYDYRTRFYHAPLGRFTSRDWIEYGGGMNLYGYVGGMPTRFMDPWGLFQYVYNPVTREWELVFEFGPPPSPKPTTYLSGLVDHYFPEVNPIIDDLEDDPAVIGIGVGIGAGIIAGGGLQGISGFDGLPPAVLSHEFPIYDGSLLGGQLRAELELGADFTGGRVGGGIDIDFRRRFGPCNDVEIGGGISVDPVTGKPSIDIGIGIKR